MMMSITRQFFMLKTTNDRYFTVVQTNDKNITKPVAFKYARNAQILNHCVNNDTNTDKFTVTCVDCSWWNDHDYVLMD